jgi:hypothetical protein
MAINAEDVEHIEANGNAAEQFSGRAAVLRPTLLQAAERRYARPVQSNDLAVEHTLRSHTALGSAAEISGKVPVMSAPLRLKRVTVFAVDHG